MHSGSVPTLIRSQSPASDPMSASAKPETAALRPGWVDSGRKRGRENSLEKRQPGPSCYTDRASNVGSLRGRTSTRGLAIQVGCAPPQPTQHSSARPTQPQGTHAMGPLGVRRRLSPYRDVTMVRDTSALNRGTRWRRRLRAQRADLPAERGRRCRLPRPREPALHRDRR